MVKTFGESADFTAFKVVDGDIYRVAWAKTMQVEKTEDGQEKESSLCDYMLERYDYKPSMDLVLNDILASGEQASMEEIREISEGLGAEPLWYMKNAMLTSRSTMLLRPSTLSCLTEWMYGSTRLHVWG